MRSFTVVLSPDPNVGGYSVCVPAMRGAISEGDTREEALNNIRDAMVGWLAVAVDNGEVPADETPESVGSEIQRILGFRAEFGWDLLVETAIVSLDLAAVA